MILVVLLASGAAVLGLSHLVEALRRPPTVPTQLTWAPGLAPQFIDVDNIRLRYVAAGSGDPVVLVHTLRTQLDMFQNVLPQLATRFRVYALDLPGHGYSAIPDTEYAPPLFKAALAGFLDSLDLRDVVVAGESIGGTVALMLAASAHPRVRAVVAVNPYDYDRGRGIRRGSALTNAIISTSAVPVLGGTIMRLRSRPILHHVFADGVANPDSLPAALSAEMYAVGNRPGHYQAFMSLARHLPEWDDQRDSYPRITMPVQIVYGEQDWSTAAERDTVVRLIPGAKLTVVARAGHFLSLDAPAAFVDAVIRAMLSRP